MSSNNKAPNIHLVGIDDGRAEIKLYAGPNKQFKMRTAVRAGVHAGNAGINGGASETGTYETEGVNYTVGDRVDGEDTRFEEYDGSPINRVAIHHALIRAGYGGEQVKIATGLPVSSFYLSGKINSQLINSKRSKLLQPVINMDTNISCADIIGNIVVAEALSAWLDDSLDDEGNIKADSATGPVGVVDFGGRTIDTVWINPPNSIDHMHSGSEQIGVLDLYDLVENGLKAKFTNISSFSRDQLEMAVRTNTVKLFGKVQDVGDIVKEGGVELQSRIDREIQRRFGSAAELDRILFVGGGSAALPGIAAKYPNAVMVKDPEFANARGMYKFLRHAQKSKG